MFVNRMAQFRPFLDKLFQGMALSKEAIPRRHLNRQKKRPSILTPEDKALTYNPVQALHLMRLHAFTTFPESVEICVRLNVNPKNGEQIVRGTANLPAGLGKEIKTAILCSDDEWQELQKQEVPVDFRIKES